MKTQIVTITNGDLTIGLFYQFSQMLTIENINAMQYNFSHSPLSDTLYLENVGSIKRVTLMNMLGQNIRKIRLNGNSKCKLNLSGLDSGIYFIRLQDEENNFYIHKIVRKSMV